VKREILLQKDIRGYLIFVYFFMDWFFLREMVKLVICTKRTKKEEETEETA